VDEPSRLKIQRLTTTVHSGRFAICKTMTFADALSSQAHETTHQKQHCLIGHGCSAKPTRDEQELRV